MVGGEQDLASVDIGHPARIVWEIMETVGHSVGKQELNILEMAGAGEQEEASGLACHPLARAERHLAVDHLL